MKKLVSKEKEIYLKELKEVVEQLAYLSFTTQGYDILTSRNFSHEDIIQFSVAVFFSTYLDDDDEKVLDSLIRFTVRLNTVDLQEITFIFNNKKVVDSFTKKYFKEEFGVHQQEIFNFDSPNLIKLYDASFCLTELLGIEIDE
jgi:hypothetical protein